MNRKTNLTRRWIAVALLAAVVPGTSAAADKATIISLDQLRSTMKMRHQRGLVLHVWASWCQPCLRELPLVAELARSARARGLDFYSVSLDDPTERGAARLTRVLDELGGADIDRAILRLSDPDAAVAQIDPGWEGDIPAFFAYDRAGKLRRSHVGEMTRPRFDRLVEGLAVKK
jgi:thiol-disulfide isomerase/thioredoxin